jgi:hypothetical protein
LTGIEQSYGLDKLKTLQKAHVKDQISTLIAGLLRHTIQGFDYVGVYLYYELGFYFDIALLKCDRNALDSV